MTYHSCNNDGLDNEECGFKVRHLVRMLYNSKLKYCKGVMKYECECIENMVSVKSKANCVKSKWTTALTSLLMTMAY